jgi:hypothetical protein
MGPAVQALLFLMSALGILHAGTDPDAIVYQDIDPKSPPSHRQVGEEDSSAGAYGAMVNGAAPPVHYLFLPAGISLADPLTLSSIV